MTSASDVSRAGVVTLENSFARCGSPGYGARLSRMPPMVSSFTYGFEQ
jgi:hypothetical protein